MLSGKPSHPAIIQLITLNSISKDDLLAGEAWAIHGFAKQYQFLVAGQLGCLASSITSDSLIQNSNEWRASNEVISRLRGFCEPVEFQVGEEGWQMSFKVIRLDGRLESWILRGLFEPQMTIEKCMVTTVREGGSYLIPKILL